MKIIFELPHMIVQHGGIKYTVDLATRVNEDPDYDVEVRFQRGEKDLIDIGLPSTIGGADDSFPECDVAVTYSDTPSVTPLVKLPQVGRVMLHMLSWGMSPDCERINVGFPDVQVFTTSERTRDKIKRDTGVDVVSIGHGFDASKWQIDNVGERGNYLALLYNYLPKKRYSLGVEIADKLYKEGVIEGVMTFGSEHMYSHTVHPKGLIRHINNAKPEQIRELFNECKCFLMPSETEGFNLTPIESTLCGCPAVICDGAIDSVFFRDKNCFITQHPEELKEFTTQVMKTSDWNYVSLAFEKSMREIMVKNQDWSVVVKKFKELVCKG
jgi:glycosyltransferase involved in cell wall biosynthesis